MGGEEGGGEPLLQRRPSSPSFFPSLHPLVQVLVAQQQQASDATAGEGASLQSECLLLAERMFGLLRLSCDAHAAAAAVAATAPPPVAAPVPPPRKSDKKRGRALESAVVVAAPAAEGLSAQARFWERVTEALYGLLGRLAALLAPASFAAVVKELLHHPLLAIRRRSLAFFNDYLRANFGAGRSGSGGSPEELALYFELLMDLGGALGGATAAAAPAAAPGSGAEAAAEADSHVQAALDATCILARHLAAAHPAPFAAALPRVLELGAQPLLQLQKQATSGGENLQGRLIDAIVRVERHLRVELLGQRRDAGDDGFVGDAAEADCPRVEHDPHEALWEVHVDEHLLTH